MHQTIKKIAPSEAPITTLNMDYVAVYWREKWIIKDKIGVTIAASNLPYFPSFTLPTDWLTTEVYQVELKMQEGCANSKCDWTCNGCTHKTTMLDTTNNFVTILKYR